MATAKWRGRRSPFWTRKYRSKDEWRGRNSMHKSRTFHCISLAIVSFNLAIQVFIAIVTYMYTRAKCLNKQKKKVICAIANLINCVKSYLCDFKRQIYMKECKASNIRKFIEKLEKEISSIKKRNIIRIKEKFSFSLSHSPLFLRRKNAGRNRNSPLYA